MTFLILQLLYIYFLFDKHFFNRRTFDLDFISSWHYIEPVSTWIIAWTF